MPWKRCTTKFNSFCRRPALHGAAKLVTAKLPVPGVDLNCFRDRRLTCAEPIEQT